MSEHEAIRKSRTLETQRVVSRIGGTLAAVGGFGYAVTLLIHGDLPDATARIAMEHIAARSEWLALKLAAVSFLACWIGAFFALGKTMGRASSSLLMSWATGIAIVGMATVVAEYAIIGHALKRLADAWAASLKQEQLRTAEILLSISGGLFHSFVLWMLGIPFVLAGTAVALDGAHPRWLGAIAMIAGLGAVVAGATRFLGLEVVPYALLYGGFVMPLNLWLVVLGAFMWRGTRR